MAWEERDRNWLETASELELLTRFRRDLHRIPELDDELPQTVAYVEGVLGLLSCEVGHPCKGSVSAFFDLGHGREAGATVAVRADMDALPICERTGVAFASEHAGCMHACGHDGHMAMALTTAVLVDRAVRAGVALARNVLFIFQPAEETTGGAKRVCESGVFERYGANRIFGFHVWPDLPTGTVWSRPGALLARSCEVHIDIHGQSTHVGKTLGLPDDQSHDTLLAASRFVAATRPFLAELSEGNPVICRFGLLQAGTVCNALAGEAKLRGTLRTFSDETHDQAMEGLRALLAKSCEETGCTFDLEFTLGYPPVVNDAGLYRAAAGVLDGDGGAPRLQELPDPLLISEDFSFYQRHLPGLFMLLGVGTPAEGAEGQEGVVEDGGVRRFATSALHTDTLMFSEEQLLPGVAVYRRLLGL